jgi:hypothetical protein
VVELPVADRGARTASEDGGGSGSALALALVIVSMAVVCTGGAIWSVRRR